MQHVRLVLVKDVEGTNRQNRQEQGRGYLSGVEGGRVQERQVVVEEIKVCLEQTVQRVQAGQVEGLEERVLTVVLLDVLVDALALVLRLQLRSSRHRQSLAGTGRLAVVDRRDGAKHRGVWRQRAGRAEPVSEIGRAHV